MCQINIVLLQVLCDLKIKLMNLPLEILYYGECINPCCYKLLLIIIVEIFIYKHTATLHGDVKARYLSQWECYRYKH